MWIAYDAVSGDVIERGSEQDMRKLAGQGDTIALARSEREWRQLTEEARLRLSGNPPRSRAPRER